jgi:hypothetical protein
VVGLIFYSTWPYLRVSFVTDLHFGVALAFLGFAVLDPTLVGRPSSSYVALAEFGPEWFLFPTFQILGERNVLNKPVYAVDQLLDHATRAQPRAIPSMPALLSVRQELPCLQPRLSCVLNKEPGDVMVARLVIQFM